MKVVLNIVTFVKESKGDINIDGAIIGPLMQTLQCIVAKAHSVTDVNLNAMRNICSIVHTFMIVYGFKFLSFFFPH